MKRFLLIALMLYALPALADEHLVPEDNQWTRAALPNGQGSLAPYYEMVIALLGDAYTPDSRARVVVMPADRPEYAVGVREKDGAYTIFHLGLRAQVWRFRMAQDAKQIDPSVFGPAAAQQLKDAIAELQQGLPDDYRDIGADRCEIGIERALGEKILGVWHAMLMQTHYTPAREVGPAGTDYHFSMQGETQYLSGKAWEPPTESDAGRLVRIAATMKDLCVTRNVRLLEQLRPQVDDMIARVGR